MKTKMKLKKVMRNTYTESGSIPVEAYDLPEPVEGLRLFAHQYGEQWRISEFTTGFCAYTMFTKDKFTAIDNCIKFLDANKKQISNVLRLARERVGEAFPVNREEE